MSTPLLPVSEVNQSVCFVRSDISWALLVLQPVNIDGSCFLVEQLIAPGVCSHCCS